MRINEVIVESKEQLVESLRIDNDTGCSPEDLALVVEAHRAGVWSEDIDSNDLISMMAEGKAPWL